MMIVTAVFIFFVLSLSRLLACSWSYVFGHMWMSFNIYTDSQFELKERKNILLAFLNLNDNSEFILIK